MLWSTKQRAGDRARTGLSEMSQICPARTTMDGSGPTGKKSMPARVERQRGMWRHFAIAAHRGSHRALCSATSQISIRPVKLAAASSPCGSILIRCSSRFRRLERRNPLRCYLGHPRLCYRLAAFADDRQREGFSRIQPSSYVYRYRAVTARIAYLLSGSPISVSSGAIRPVVL